MFHLWKSSDDNLWKSKKNLDLFTLRLRQRKEETKTMSLKKKYQVVVYSTATWEYNVEANSPEEAEEIVLSGNAVDQGEIISEEVTDAEVFEIE